MFQLHQDGCLQQVRAATAPVSAAPPPAPGASRDTDRLRRAAGAPRTVVVLGGTAAFRRELCEDLRKAGCEAVEALNDQTVLDLVRNQAVHAILLDASADLQPAWGALLHLNAMTNVPVIVMSPNRAREDIIQTIKHGARDYIVKPFARSYLLDRLLRIWEPDAPRQTETMIMRRATGEEKRN
jgi:DNA-binding response OmpR family regulator